MESSITQYNDEGRNWRDGMEVAVKAYRDSIELGQGLGSNSEVRFHLAVALERLGEVEESEKIMELDIEELRRSGFELNASKTKNNTNAIQIPNFNVVGGAEVSIIEETSNHRYLSIYLSGVFENSGIIEVAHCPMCLAKKTVDVRVPL